MEYYIMEADKRIHNRVIIKEFPDNASIEYDTSHASRLKEHTALYTIENDGSAYPEIIEAPLYMVSEKVKEVLDMYDEEAVYKAVSLINRAKQSVQSYHVTLVDRIECLHELTEFYPDKSIKRLVLDKTKLEDRALFKVAGIGPAYMIVSLDVAESLLRRGSFGIKFTHVESK